MTTVLAGRVRTGVAAAAASTRVAVRSVSRTTAGSPPLRTPSRASTTM